MTYYFIIWSPGQYFILSLPIRVPVIQHIQCSLNPPTKHPDLHHNNSNTHLIFQISQDEKIAVAMFHTDLIYVWDIGSRTLSFSISPSKHIGTLKVEADFYFTVTADAAYLVITRDVANSPWDSHKDKNTSCGIFNLRNGKSNVTNIFGLIYQHLKCQESIRLERKMYKILNKKSTISNQI